MDARLLAQMLEDFLDESQEHVDDLNDALIELEKNPVDTELINRIFRRVHTLKGTSAFVGLEDITTLAHKMEDVFDAIRKEKLPVTSELIDIMFEALETLVSLRNDVISGNPSGKDLSSILGRLTETFDCTVRSPGRQKKQRAPQGDQEAVLSGAAQEVAEPEGAPSLPRSVKNLSLDTIRVRTKRLDNLMNLTGELVSARNSLLECAGKLGNRELNKVTNNLKKIAGQIQGEVMGLRMVSVTGIFNRFPGVVRKMAREHGKEIEFTVQGKETEFDRNMIEQIYDPLVHLLRNAVDHGIESAQERLEAGKRARGRILLTASQKQGSVLIEVADDGRGIDCAKIREIAVAKGIVNREEADELSDEQAVRLIFTPGFSTVEVVSDVSGRGVGMDVVQENIRRLKGLVEIQTKVGKGTTFKLQLPLTLSIRTVFLFKLRGRIYALPLSSILETMIVETSQIQQKQSLEMVFVRGQAIPLKRLHPIFFEDQAEIDDTRAAPKTIPVMVVGIVEKRVALAVSELIEKQEIVLKPLGNYLGKVHGIEGAAVLADGSVTLVLDVDALVA